MTEITSNITFENKDGQITKCVLKITGGKTFTVTLGNKGYEVKEEGNVTLSPSSGSDSSSSSGSSNPGSNSSNSTPGAASTTANAAASTPSAPLQPSQEKEYNTQEDLITTLGSYGYTAPQ